ncbi:uncharacterized protein LOC114754676 isoform X3 [Neltuma alba]|uniref:uncharacterized protein LOC114711565 isoform X3 n=1 Tax=Neltuma alba TaxID=207710 RepID=UPI0010A2E7AB|nr:uncharacterized protein LOC114711565 isoform X3 [Prosopis alba]XP_028799310.1 uncharacterized protein LOC114754676 isoform X3 [Prosopis alba]
MRILQVAICQNRFEPGDNQLCSSPPEVAVDSAFFLAIFSSNSESPAWFLNKLVKILRYSSDHRRDLIIFMAHETYRSDVRKKIGSYQVESAEQKKRNLKRNMSLGNSEKSSPCFQCHIS